MLIRMDMAIALGTHLVALVELEDNRAESGSASRTVSRVGLTGATRGKVRIEESQARLSASRMFTWSVRMTIHRHWCPTVASSTIPEETRRS